MPEHVAKAELHIEDGSIELYLTCLSSALTEECINGPLDSSSTSRIRLKNGVAGLNSRSEISFHGSWEQREENIVNCVRGLWAYCSEEGMESDLLRDLNFTIHAREDDTRITDNTIILSGTAISGTLILPDGDEYPLSGAGVRLTYTIDSAHVNDTTHGTPAP